MGNEDGTSNKDYQSREIETGSGSGSGSGNECNEIASTSSHTDSEHENERILHSRIRATVHEDALSAVKKIKASHQSSTSSDSCSEFVIEVDIRLVSKSKAKSSSSVIFYHDVRDLAKHPKVDESECSTSHASDLTNESLQNIKISTTSPPIQVMEMPSGFDLNRIPSSVFVCKSQKESEWSTVSNDSLFSIHLGKESFAREHRHKFSVDFHHKSVGSDDFSKHGGGGIGKPPLAVVKGKGSGRNNIRAGKKIREIATVDRRVIDDHLEIFNYESDKIVPPLVSMDDADASEIQSCSYHREEQSSGHGSYCSYMCGTCCCCCRWPSCSTCCKFPICKWPSCSWRKCWSCCWPCGSCCCSWRKCWSCCWPCGSCCCSSKPSKLYSCS